MWASVCWFRLGHQHTFDDHTDHQRSPCTDTSRWSFVPSPNAYREPSGAITAKNPSRSRFPAAPFFTNKANRSPTSALYSNFPPPADSCPFLALRDAVLTHPTLVEGLIPLDLI